MIERSISKLGMHSVRYLLRFDFLEVIFDGQQSM